MCLLAQSQPQAPNLQESLVQPWHVQRRTAHENFWECTKAVTDAATGRQMIRAHNFVELATGLNALGPDGIYHPAQCAFALTERGAEAQGTQHKLQIASDIYTAGAIQVLAGGQNLMFSPCAIGYSDPVNGAFVLLAAITNSIGWLTASNEVVFSNCFSGFLASIHYRNTLAGISQTVLIEEAPPDPQLFGLSQHARIQLFNEVAAGTPVALQNQRLLPQQAPPSERAAWLDPA
jgi:hypothetical protein